MLDTDEIILNILLDAKKENNQLLHHFKINYPNNRVAEESNSIFVASVDSEGHTVAMDSQSFIDRVEILITTKNQDYQKAIRIIKTVSREITRLIMDKKDLFYAKPVVERVTPEYNKDFVLTRGHIMIQVKTDMDNFNADEETLHVCKILTEDMDVIEE